MTQDWRRVWKLKNRYQAWEIASLMLDRRPAGNGDHDLDAETLELLRDLNDAVTVAMDSGDLKTREEQNAMAWEAGIDMRTRTATFTDVRDWLAAQEFDSTFFLGAPLRPPTRPDYLDEAHPRYSAKLACAVAAWEAMAEAKQHRGVKQQIEDWVIENGARFGLTTDEAGETVPTVVQEIAKVVNWRVRGGAPSSSG